MDGQPVWLLAAASFQGILGEPGARTAAEVQTLLNSFGESNHTQDSLERFKDKMNVDMLSAIGNSLVRPGSALATSCLSVVGQAEAAIAVGAASQNFSCS